MAGIQPFLSLYAFLGETPSTAVPERWDPPSRPTMVQGVVVEDGCIVDVNPSTGALIAKVPCSTAAEVDRAVVAARTAQPTWQECGLPQRHELIAGALLKLKDRQGGLDGLAELISLEMGKVLSEAKDEVAGAVDKDHFLKLVRAANEDELIDEATGTTMVRDPHGVVAVISPWNFPADEILLLALPALMAGNTVIVKPSEVTPLVGKAVVESLQETLPPGVLGLLQGDGEVGKLLVAHKGIDMIGFTGSCATGRSIMAAAAPDLKRIVLELGGKDPMVVFADADLELAADQAVQWSLHNCGQVCCAVERVYIEAAAKEAFEAKCLEKIKAWKAGDALDEDSRIGPMVSQRQKQLVVGHVADALGAGARCLHGGVDEQGGNFLSATLLTDVPHTAKITREETFGPVLALTAFDGAEDTAVHLCNDSDFGLTAAVFSADTAKARRVSAKIRAGQVGINNWPFANAPARAPWVGARGSGFGFHSGADGWRQFSVPKTLVVIK